MLYSLQDYGTVDCYTYLPLLPITALSRYQARVAALCTYPDYVVQHGRYLTGIVKRVARYTKLDGCLVQAVQGVNTTSIVNSSGSHSSLVYSRGVPLQHNTDVVMLVMDDLTRCAKLHSRTVVSPPLLYLFLVV
jgi:hypothetical protein